jgi:hypothetical protein
MAGSRNKVTVNPVPRQSGTGWVLDAVYPNGQPAAIRGFRTEAEAYDWPGSIRHVAWLRDNRVGPGAQVAVAASWLLHWAAVIGASAALSLMEFAKQAQESVQRALETQAAREATARLRALGLRLVPLTSELLARGRKLRRAAQSLMATPPLNALNRRGLLAGALLIGVVAFAMSRHSEQPAVPASIEAPQIAIGAQLPHAQSIETTDADDPIALLIDRLSSSEAVADPPIDAAVEPTVARRDQPDELPAEPQATQPRPDLPTPREPTIAGTWMPEPNSCAARHSQDGVLPAVITAHGARAGETSCTFKRQKHSEGDWRMLANCANPRENWTVEVRLTVKGDRLIWTSKRGTQAYTRCRSAI